jgi:Icc-related predicted phosphoesterase
MRLLIFGDTHGQHLQLPKLPEADVVVFAGDFCNSGSMVDCIRFLNWFNMLDYKHRICIAGNHDRYMDEGSPSGIRVIIPPGVTYLQESGIEIEGLKFWGSPYTPTFLNWYFMADRGLDIQKHWDKIPDDTDILITHGPVRGIHDLVPKWEVLGAYENVGCEDLQRTVEMIKPMLHICGHVHCGYGIKSDRYTTYINASVCNEDYNPLANKPVLVDIDGPDVKVVSY